jgi:hypothetical protein
MATCINVTQIQPKKGTQGRPTYLLTEKNEEDWRAEAEPRGFVCLNFLGRLVEFCGGGPSASMLELMIIEYPAMRTVVENLLNGAGFITYDQGLVSGDKNGYHRGFGHGTIRGRNEGRRLEREAALKEGFLAGQQAGVRACQLFHLLDAQAFLVAIRQLAPGFDQGLLPTSGPSLESEDFGDPTESPSASTSTADADVAAISDDQHSVTAPVLASDLGADTPSAPAVRAANADLPLADDSLMGPSVDEDIRLEIPGLDYPGADDPEPEPDDSDNPDAGAGTTH